SLAGGATAVEGHNVSFIAGFSTFQHAVAARGCGADARATVTLGTDFNFARSAAAIVRSQVSVIALLGKNKNTVSALGEGAARLSGIGAYKAGLDKAAVAAAAIAALQIAIVA